MADESKNLFDDEVKALIIEALTGYKLEVG
jgi:hypothetical protein